MLDQHRRIDTERVCDFLKRLELNAFGFAVLDIAQRCYANASVLRELRLSEIALLPPFPNAEAYWTHIP